MKAQLIITCISLLLIVGCSYDPVEEPLVEAVPSELKEKAPKTITVHAKEVGELWTEVSPECPTRGLHMLQGQFESKSLGHVKTRYSICLDKGYNLSGSFKTSKKDRIYYQAFRISKDDIGVYFRVQVIGGEGKYFEATGKIKLYLELDLLDKGEGVYFSKWEGSIQLP